jgi:hypothetical protein
MTNEFPALPFVIPSFVIRHFGTPDPPLSVAALGFMMTDPSPSGGPSGAFPRPL